MQFKQPKNDGKYEWTNHVKGKMVYYGISESLIKRIIRAPKRIEYGVAPETVAVMQPTSSKKNPQEIWVMYQEAGKTKANPFAIKKRVISAWRYPGVTKPGAPIPIPDDVLIDLENS